MDEKATPDQNLEETSKSKKIKTVSFSNSTIERAHGGKVKPETKPERKPFESTESEEEEEQKQPREYMFWPPAIGFPGFMLS